MTKQALLAAILFGAWNGDCMAGDAFSGLIIHVADGETLTLIDERNGRHTIRLAGIEAPKSRHLLSGKSAANLGALAYGHEADADCAGKDRSGRERCVVMVDGVDIGLAQLKEGMAWQATQPAFRARASYLAGEQYAKQRRSGVWLETPRRPAAIGMTAAPLTSNR